MAMLVITRGYHYYYPVVTSPVTPMKPPEITAPCWRQLQSEWPRRTANFNQWMGWFHGKRNGRSTGNQWNIMELVSIFLSFLGDLLGEFSIEHQFWEGGNLSLPFAIMGARIRKHRAARWSVGNQELRPLPNTFETSPTDLNHINKY